MNNSTVIVKSVLKTILFLSFFWGLWFLLEKGMPVIREVQFWSNFKVTLPFGISRGFDPLIIGIVWPLVYAWLLGHKLAEKHISPDRDIAATFISGLIFGAVAGLVIVAGIANFVPAIVATWFITFLISISFLSYIGTKNWSMSDRIEVAYLFSLSIGWGMSLGIALLAGGLFGIIAGLAIAGLFQVVYVFFKQICSVTLTRQIIGLFT